MRDTIKPRPMKYLFSLMLLAGSIAGARAADIPLPNSGFEDGLNGWVVAKQDAYSTASPEAARSNNLGLLVNDQDAENGSGVASTWFRAKAGKVYEVDFWSRLKSGEGVAVYLRFRDAQNRTLTSSQSKNELLLTIPKDARQWSPFSLKGEAPAGTAYVSIWIHSFSKNKVVAHFDDFTLTVSD